MKKFDQMKSWPTRRIHLFPTNSSVSVCGVVVRGQSHYIQTITQKEALEKHKYDDLNYCQTCLRSIMKKEGKDYIPLSVKYKKTNS